MILLFGLLLLIILLGILAFAMLESLWRDAPFIPTGRKELSRIFDAVGVKPGQMVYDLGSGDGRVVREAARRGARAIGIERSLVLTWWARALRWFEGKAPWRLHVQKTPVVSRFIQGDFLNRDISDADVIFCYLMPGAMVKLKEKFERELAPGVRVVSRAFSIPGWNPNERLKFSKRGMPIYTYTVPRY